MVGGLINTCHWAIIVARRILSSHNSKSAYGGLECLVLNMACCNGSTKKSTLSAYIVVTTTSYLTAAAARSTKNNMLRVKESKELSFRC